ncbi:MAG: hypothetical protein R3B47_05725 [Bacteroidia bacterium]
MKLGDRTSDEKACTLYGNVWKAGVYLRAKGYNTCNASQQFRLVIRRARADGKEVRNAEFYYTGYFEKYDHRIRSDSRYAKMYLYSWSTGCNCWEPLAYGQFWPPF